MIKWGFIGCGNVTEKKSGPAFSKVEGSMVTAVMSRDEKKVKDYAQRHNIPNGTQTLRNLSMIRM